MRILFVTQVHLDQPHGGPRHVLAVARELARLGHQVTLLAPGQTDEPDGVRRLRPPASLRAGLRLEGVQALLALRELERHHYDVGYVRMSASTSLVPAALFAARLPLVLELNGRIIDELALRGRGRAAQTAARTVLSGAVGLARGVVAASAKVGRHAEQVLGAQRVFVVENGADLDAATPGDRADARRRLGLAPGGRYLTFVGSLVEEQQIELLLDAHRRLRALAPARADAPPGGHAGAPGVGLLFAGDGPKARLVEAAAQDAPAEAPVIALGAVPHPRAIDAIRAADACVNVREGDIGMKCWEYAAVGRRFVTLEVEGIERLIGLYPGLEAAQVVKARTPEALAAGLTAALDAEARLGPLPADAVAAARAAIGWEHTARQIAGVLERCASFS